MGAESRSTIARGSFASALAALLLLAASTGSGAQRVVEVGMSIDEVRKMLGRAERRSSRGPDTAWVYVNQVGQSISRCEYATLWFRDDILRGISTRYGGIGEQCESFGRVARPRIDWDEMPE